MKKYSRIISMFSLILAVTLLFSGCGVIDFAKSVFSKEEATTGMYETTAPVNNNLNNIVPSDGYTVDSIVISPDGTTTVIYSQPASGTTGTTASNATSDATTTTVSGDSTTSTTNVAPTPTPSQPEAQVPQTQAPETQGEVKETLPANATVKDLQDMLFDTTDPNKAADILEACGFLYDSEQGIYYSTMHPLQRYFGYNFLYDLAAPRVGMYYSTKRIFFEYDDKDWMIQIWKGQYGITAGAEIGLYNKTNKIMQYDCASDDELITMAFDFYNNGEYVFSRGPEEHWWLTGFKIFHIGVGILIDLDMTLTFPTVEMANAFEKGLKEAISPLDTDKMTYKRTAKTFSIQW